MLLILTWNNQKEKDVDHYGSNKLIIKIYLDSFNIEQG